MDQNRHRWVTLASRGITSIRGWACANCGMMQNRFNLNSTCRGRVVVTTR